MSSVRDMPGVRRARGLTVLVRSFIALVAVTNLWACTMPQQLLLSLLPDGTFLVPLQNLRGADSSVRDRLAQLEARGDWKETAELARTNLKKDAQSAEWWYVLGSAEARLGHWRVARDAFRDSLRIDPSEMDAWHMLSLCQGQLGERAMAIQTLERALDVSRQSPLTFFFLGEQYRLGGETQRAAEAYREALRLSPGFSEAKQALARLR